MQGLSDSEPLADGYPPSRSKLDLALHQLERAILLHLDEKDYICAITLAGAADELLRALVEQIGVTPALTRRVDLTVALCDDDEIDPKLLAKYVADMANYHRNELKHYRDGSPLLVLEENSADMLQRAISNVYLLTGGYTPAGQRYMVETIDR